MKVSWVRALRQAAAGAAIGCALLGATQTAGAATSAIVVDANTGQVVYALDPDGARFPASITKVMTLYLLFEQIEAGRMTMNTRLAVSANAARQPPTRLGVRAGDTIRVEDAIMALITRSANDVAVVVAENIAGSVDSFAERMTRRAHQLGMTRTTFRNPHGLPNPEQRTTARDLAILGRAVYERFPAYSRMFSRRSFAFGRRTIMGHNRLLGRITAVDGIKTGYTNASGYNLLTSARADGRHLVAVVIGGRTGASRDAEMAGLVNRFLPRMASRRTDFSIALRVRGRNAAAEAVVAQAGSDDRPAQREERVAAARPLPVPMPPAPPASAVMALAPASEQTAATAAAASAAATGAPTVLTPPPTPVAEATRREIQTAAPVRVASAGGMMQWQTGAQPLARAAETTGSVGRAPASAPAEAVPAAVAPAGGWVVQIAAAPTLNDAQRLLREAREAVGRGLGRGTPLTEPVQRGASTLYRARFAGFGDRSEAEAACAVLKRNDYQCMAIRL